MVVALDASRYLNNGEPSELAAWLDALEVSRGARFLQIGCGVGYYTVLVAHVASPRGLILALEADPELADLARQNLAAYANIEVRHATGPTPADGPFDAVFVNAGATEILPSWLDRLADGGRLLVPLTTTRSINRVGGDQIGLGHMLRVERRTESYLARFVSPVGIFQHRRSHRARRADPAGGVSAGRVERGAETAARPSPRTGDVLAARFLILPTARRMLNRDVRRPYRTTRKINEETAGQVL